MDQEKRKNKIKLEEAKTINAAKLLIAQDALINREFANFPHLATWYRGRNCWDAYMKLYESGFTNISLVPMEDLVIGFRKSADSVDSVLIDGRSDYNTKKTFPCRCSYCYSVPFVC